MVSNPISIQLWTPSSPEVTIEAYASSGTGIETSGSGRVEIEDRTVTGGLVITGQATEPVELIVVSEVLQSVVGNLDEIRLYQIAGEQANFRFNSYVSNNDLGMNRVATGTTQTWGTSTRTRFQAPCLIEFAPEWYRLNLSRGEDNYRLNLTIYEIP